MAPSLLSASVGSSSAPVEELEVSLEAILMARILAFILVEVTGSDGIFFLVRISTWASNPNVQLRFLMPI